MYVSNYSIGESYIRFFNIRQIYQNILTTQLVYTKYSFYIPVHIKPNKDENKV